jgi:hypothetical protein
MVHFALEVITLEKSMSVMIGEYWLHMTRMLGSCNWCAKIREFLSLALNKRLTFFYDIVDITFLINNSD